MEYKEGRKLTEWLIKNCRYYQDHRFIKGDLLFRDGKVASDTRAGENASVVDAEGRYLVPGFLDIHTHGGNNIDVNAASPRDIETIASFFASHGTTGFQTSILTDTPEKTLECIGNVAATKKDDYDGAEIIGIHLEGPFLSPMYKGAMPEELLRPADPAWLEACLNKGEGLVRYMTVAPEVEGVKDLIRDFAGRITFALGHSGATYQDTMDCIALGAKACTHTFNGMRLFHQHEPAIMGAVLESDVYCEAICDGRHLHPGSVRMLIKAKGLDRVVAITDSIQAAGLPDGHYHLGINDVYVKDGDAKLADGTRAGSTLTMDRALKNLVSFTGLPVEKVLPLLTENPADLLGLKEKGRLNPGCDADAVLLDEDLNVRKTFVHGREVFTAAE